LPVFVLVTNWKKVSVFFRLAPERAFRPLRQMVLSYRLVGGLQSWQFLVARQARASSAGRVYFGGPPFSVAAFLILARRVDPRKRRWPVAFDNHYWRLHRSPNADRVSAEVMLNHNDGAG
jgi:hypothetical protein